MKILVTGGSGFIGRNIVLDLLKRGHKVIVIDDLSRGINISGKTKSKFQFIHGSVLNLKTLNKLTENVDCIYHLAAINGTKNFYSYPDKVLEVGCKGIINLLDASKDKGIDKLYLFSSSEVYQKPKTIPTPEKVLMKIPDPFNPRYSYAGSKIISEQMGIHIGSKIFNEVKIIRPHNVYGPNMGKEHVIPELINKIKYSQYKNLKTIKIEGNGKETRSFMYIDDFVKALSLIDKKTKNTVEIFNVGVSQEISILNLCNRILKELNLKINIEFTKKKKGATNRRCPDVSKITSLGFKPKFSLEKGLSKTIKWYLKN